MRRRVSALLVIFSITAAASAEGTQSRSRQNRIYDSVSGRVPIVVGFGIEERQYISEWFHESGLAKRAQLPPGLQRQLQKDGKLPPGLEQRFEPLPGPLEVKLPELPAGTRRIVLGDNVILLDETTSFIVDIITGI